MGIGRNDSTIQSQRLPLDELYIQLWINYVNLDVLYIQLWINCITQHPHFPSLAPSANHSHIYQRILPSQKSKEMYVKTLRGRSQTWQNKPSFVMYGYVIFYGSLILSAPSAWQLNEQAPIPAQRIWGNLVSGLRAVFSHTMPKMGFYYSHRFSWEKA